MRSPFQAGPPHAREQRGEAADGSGSYRTHHWDRRSCLIALILLLFFAATVLAVWITLTADNPPASDPIATPSPTVEGIAKGTTTPTSS